MERRGSEIADMAFDSYQHGTLARVEDTEGRKIRGARLAHAQGALPRLLSAGESSVPGAV